MGQITWAPIASGNSNLFHCPVLYRQAQSIRAWLCLELGQRLTQPSQADPYRLRLQLLLFVFRPALPPQGNRRRTGRIGQSRPVQAQPGQDSLAMFDAWGYRGILEQQHVVAQCRYGRHKSGLRRAWPRGMAGDRRCAARTLLILGAWWCLWMATRKLRLDRDIVIPPPTEALRTSNIGNSFLHYNE